MRVGMLTYDFHPHIGGQGRVTYDLWRRLREREGLDVHVISPSSNGLAGHHSRFGFTQRAGRHPLFSALASVQVRRWVRELGMDVLLVNGGPGGVLLLSDAGVPVVYSLYHTYEQSSRLMSGQGWKAPVVAVERAAYKRSTIIAASTASTAGSVRDGIGVSAPVVEIPCGVDFEAFRRIDVEREDDLVLFVGRLDVRKNAQLLLRAFASVAARRANARLAIVGRGPLEGRLRELARSLGITSRVRFEGAVGHDQLVRWYSRAAVVVVPSLFEGFGLSAVEAQACGACVVATDTEGLRDVVVDGETGVLTPLDADALAEEIVELLEDAGRRRVLGDAAAAHVRQAYSWEPIVDRWVELLRSAACDSGALPLAA